MLKTLQTALLTSALALTGATALADSHKVKAGDMAADKNIVETAIHSKDHTTLVTAVQAADLVKTLSGEGPFTLFAPVNDGFAALPEGAVENLLKPENKDQLVKVLTAHVVAGNVSSQDLMREIEAAGDAGFNITTVSGDTLIAKINDGNVILVDENGGESTVTVANLEQSNGVIHVVDKVLLPK